MVFTEQGVAMLSSVLNSKRANAINLRIIRVFVKMRRLVDTQKEILIKQEALEKKDIELDEKVAIIFEYLKHLELAKQEEEDFKNR